MNQKKTTGKAIMGNRKGVKLLMNRVMFVKIPLHQKLYVILFSGVQYLHLMLGDFLAL